MYLDIYVFGNIYLYNVYRHTSIYLQTYICVKIMEKEAMNLQESKKGYMGIFREIWGKSKWYDYSIISKNKKNNNKNILRAVSSREFTYEGLSTKVLLDILQK